MDSKLCIVTGANSGIGKETARGLAARGARVVMVCRDRGRAEAARADILGSVPGARIDILLADFASENDVRDVADEIGRRYDKIDVLLNNAGIHLFHREETGAGHERMLAVNYLAPFLLTNLVLDQIVASGSARIVTVASEAHRLARGIDFDDLEATKLTPGFRWSFQTYGRTKLMGILFAQELAERTEKTRVTSNALCPGLVATKLFAEQAQLARLAQVFSSTWFVRTPAQGAQMPIRLAVDPALADITGQFFTSAHIMRPVPAVRARSDDAMQKRLWDVGADLTSVRAPNSIET